MEAAASAKPRPAYSPEGTTLPRHIAAVLDNILASLLAIIAAKQLPDSLPAMQIGTIVIAYFAYYFVFELACCTTPAKFMNGLTVRSFDGGRCSCGQSAVRTLTRVIEVNPVFLGGLPAAASILWSRDKQRIGDKLAGTVVVRR